MGITLENRKAKNVITKPIVVFYHADCTDGFTAAWVAWKKFGSKAQYIAYNYDDPIPDMNGKEIYTLDFTFEEDGLIAKLKRQNRRLTSIDHHVSNKKLTLSTHKPLYALHHSGCVLAWKYFFPDKPVPKFLLTVEDVDLWTNKIKGGPELYGYLDLFGFDFKVWTKAVNEFEVSKKRKHILEVGRLLKRQVDMIVIRCINKYARLVNFSGHRVYAINANDFASQFGHALYKFHPSFAVIWKQTKDGQVAVSLRGDGSIDVSKLALKYGGGGHRNSAAFNLSSLSAIPWKPVK